MFVCVNAGRSRAAGRERASVLKSGGSEKWKASRDCRRRGGAFYL
jgi:hypothetical protein